MELEANEDDLSYKNFMDYLTTEENKLPEEEETRLDNPIKICIEWAKGLDDSLPDNAARTLMRKLAKGIIEKFNGFRRKILKGKHRQEPSPDVCWQEVDKEFDTFRGKLNELYSTSSSSSTDVKDVLPVGGASKVECGANNDLPVDAENASGSGSATASASESVQQQQPFSAVSEEPTHEQFVLYLSRMKYNLSQETCVLFCEAMKLFITWAGNLENVIQSCIASQCQMSKLRSEFITFAKEAIRGLNLLSQMPEYYQGLLFESMMEEICQQFKNFKQAMVKEYCVVKTQDDEED